jgi:hypothetical protein
MSRSCFKITRIATLLGLSALLAAPPARGEEDWFHLGLVRVRDLTPFGITRLDMLPPHSVASTPGTWAIETNFSYQNTFVLSDNVAEYLRQRGGGRVDVTQDDIRTLLDSGEDVYLIDGELGLADLTLHYRFDSHWGTYVTLPVLYLDGGFLDGTIESFHENVGLSTANRDLSERNRFVAIFGIDGQQVALTEAPFRTRVMDPVLGLRHSLFAEPKSFNVITELAVKLARQDAELLTSTGENDYGVQISLQKFFRRQALYLTASGVYVGSSPAEGFEDQVVPTALLGYELRLTRHTNAILQLYASRGDVRNTTIEELAADKYQLTLGLQSVRRGWVYRFALTENLANFENTPDVGVTLSLAKVIFGRKR